LRIPSEKIEIAEEKLLNYLLVKKARNDKSGFLTKLGFTKDNWKELRDEISEIVNENEATLQQETEFGSLYEVKGELRNFGVITIWFAPVHNDKFRFITLFPDRTKK